MVPQHPPANSLLPAVARLQAAGRWPGITSDEGNDTISLRNSADFCNAIA